MTLDLMMDSSMWYQKHRQWSFSSAISTSFPPESVTSSLFTQCQPLRASCYPVLFKVIYCTTKSVFFIFCVCFLCVISVKSIISLLQYSQLGTWASEVVLVVKNPPTSAGDIRGVGLIPGSGRSPGGGQATHSSILSWRSPGTEDSGRIHFTGSQRVGHD